ncbi:ABC transporter permease [Blastococcus saxobsidens]|uniref:ABC-2 type transport system permease protein n=1 Tax=Blastococcus saxobsidens TaxID=138336 RepID=A0A4Q7YDV2_9ACTN|nr:ABC transporter permease [Blastococcus saxobsidens]RZU34399.1 ABC-2 type transport system permease protein [Blastococcus saxobsidens]
MSAPSSTERGPGSGELVRLVAGREISTRLRDKNFLVGLGVTILLLLGLLFFQVLMSSGSDERRLGIVGDGSAVAAAVEAQGEAVGVDVTVVELDDEDAARAAVEAGEVDGALLASGPAPELLLRDRSPTMEAVVNAAVAGIAVAEQLAEAGVDLAAVPEVEVTALSGEDDEAEQEQVLVAIIGVVLLYGLLIMFGQFIAQGVVEEKSSRVVELLLATMRPWQLLAGKIIGLGVLGLAQIVIIGVIGVAGALAFDLVAVPGDLVGTVVSVVLWFVLGYAFYAAIFAMAASLVSRQEDLGSVLTPMILLLVVGFFIGLQAASDPAGTMAVVTSYVPGLSPLVMPVRQAAGEVAVWEIAVAVVIMLVAIVAAVRIGGRIYAGALLRTSGKTRLREALEAGRG